MGERGRRGRVGEVVGGHVDRLHRCDRALVGGRDPLLQLAHLGGQRRLVADGAGHAAEQRRHLGACLDEAKDVVDEEQHVLAALVAEVLGHGQAAQADPQAGARRLVHLAVDQSGLLDHLRLGHLQPQVVALAGALAHAGEHGQAAVLRGDVVDQLQDQHRLAHAGAAEQADLAALHVRGQQVDDLDPGLQDLGGRRQVLEQRRVAVDLPTLLGLHRFALVDRLTQHVEDPAQRLLADWDADRRSRVDHVQMTGQAVGGVHRDGAHPVVTQVLLHLGDQRRSAIPPRYRDVEGAVDGGQLVLEHGVDDDALDLDDLPDVVAVTVRHVTPLCWRASPAFPRKLADSIRRPTPSAQKFVTAGDEPQPSRWRCRVRSIVGSKSGRWSSACTCRC